MEEESCGIHSDDDKTLPDKNKKRIVKTRSQIEALEKFYNEHKYPSEPMKIQLAESIGLTEKQVSGWFCHRRLKDKRLLNGETYAIGRQDRSSGVIQDQGSGLRQDSCGSTKQGDDRNFDTREVESERLTLQEFSTADLTCERGSQFTGNYNHMNDATSGSSSSLRNMSSHHNGGPFDVATSRYLIPKFPVEMNGVKARSGPSGYLKVKGPVENSAITAVKRQLGRQFREDGAPLGVEFDPLPPGAFESSAQNPIDETLYSGEPVLPVSPDVSKICQYPRSGKGCESNSGMAYYNSSMDGVKTTHGFDTPENYVQQKFGQKTSFPNNGAYYPGRNFSVEFPESSAKDIPGSESRDDYQMRSRQGVEVVRMGSVSNLHHLQPYGGKVKGERAESLVCRYNDVDAKISQGGDIENVPSYIAIKGNEYHNLEEKGLSQQIIKDGKFYGERIIMNENCEPVQVKIPLKNEMSAPKRMKGEFPHQQHQKRSLMVDNRPWSSQVIRSRAKLPSSFSEDEGSAETSSSVD